MPTLFFSAFAASFLISALVIYLSHKHMLFLDCHIYEKPQKFHNFPVPRAGGIGIFVVMAILSIWYDIRYLPALTLVFLSGIFEDFHNSLSPKTRLVLQIIAAVSIIWLTNSVVTYLGLGISLPYWLGVFFSVFAIVGMTNAINIIDGFNGLASGVVLMISASFLFVAWHHNDTELMRLLYGVAGATLGFFVLVFPKGRIFLGDGGAYVLGFIVAVIGISLAGRYDDVSPWYVLAMFIYPVWEVIFSIVRKVSMGRSPLKPDRYHFHMLVHRHLVSNNSLTALFILIFIAPFMFYATMHANCSRCNVEVVITFIICYMILYSWLYRKEKKS